MKITIYVRNQDFDSFFRWVKQLQYGALSTPPVFYSHRIDEVEDPLMISLDSDIFYLIQDSQEHLTDIKSSLGSLDLLYQTDNQEEHLQMIKEGLRKARREDMELELVYSALAAMKEMPGLTPGEAIIVAEKSILG